MIFEHQSVLLEEVMALLSPRDGGVYCDGTLGGGGHAERLLELSAPSGRLLGIDRDVDAISSARQRLARFGDRVTIRHGRFSQIDQFLDEAGIASLDGLLLDLGVSSFQLNEAMRGFSFANSGPLDMRMDASDGETAGELLTRMSESELADVIYRFGEERLSRKIARSIKQMERDGALNSTADLAVAVKKVVHQRPGKSDPATRTFQAIRIAVNREMEELEKVLGMLPEPLAVGGSVVVISFHSLEDRMVKRRFEELVNPCSCPPGMPQCPCSPPQAQYNSRRKVKVSAVERDGNRRSRSATARSIRRIR